MRSENDFFKLRHIQCELGGHWKRARGRREFKLFKMNIFCFGEFFIRPLLSETITDRTINRVHFFFTRFRIKFIAVHGPCDLANKPKFIVL